MSIANTFPLLEPNDFEITSPRTPDYNCIAWAAGDANRWWEKSPLPGYYWPDGHGDEAEDVARIFKERGYEGCGIDTELEVGFEKIAIYTDDYGVYTHVARQLDDGWWTSKIGGWEDIRHKSPHSLAGAEYGTVAAVMKRKKNGAKRDDQKEKQAKD